MKGVLDNLVDDLLDNFQDEYINEAVDDLCNSILSLEPDLQEKIIKRFNSNINKVKPEVFDPDLKNIYYEEFELIFGDSGEEEAVEDMLFHIGREDEGSVERLKYLTMWYDKRVKEGLYSGITK